MPKILAAVALTIAASGCASHPVEPRALSANRLSMGHQAPGPDECITRSTLGIEGGDAVSVVCPSPDSCEWSPVQRYSFGWAISCPPSAVASPTDPLEWGNLCTTTLLCGRDVPIPSDVFIFADGFESGDVSAWSEHAED